MIMHRQIADWPGQHEDVYDDVETDGSWFGNLEMEGNELFQADESSLSHHYRLSYTPPATRAGTQRDREWSPSAIVTRSSRDSELSEAWLDGNRQAVEANKFFSLAIEPDAIVKVTPGLKKRKWMHRQVIQH
jgi:hypothetical protein